MGHNGGHPAAGRRPARRDTQKEGGGDGHKALERRRQFPRREPEVEHKTDGGRDQEARRAQYADRDPDND